MTQSGIFFLIVLVVRRATSLTACLVRWRPPWGRRHWEEPTEKQLLEDKKIDGELKMKFFFCLLTSMSDTVTVKMKY